MWSWTVSPVVEIKIKVEFGDGHGPSKGAGSRVMPLVRFDIAAGVIPL